MNTRPDHPVTSQSSLKKWGLLCLAWLAFLITPGHAAQVQTELRTASDDGNLWVVVRNSKVPGEWRLLHHGSDMGGPYARVARTFQYRPKALSASGGRVFVLFDPPLPTMDSMDLVSIEIQRNEGTGTYYELPLSGWDSLASVPFLDGFGGLVSTSNGPVVLELPSMKAAKGITRTRGAQDDPSDEAARLLEQRAYQWSVVEGPDSLKRLEQQRLVPSQADRLALLSSSPDGTAILHLQSDSAWSQQVMDFAYARLLRVASGENRLIFALTTSTLDPESGRAQFELVMTRGGTVLRLGTYPIPEGAWGIAGLGGRIMILSTDEKTQVLVSEIDSLTGDQGPAVSWAAPPLEVQEWIHLPVLGMMVVAALLAIIFLQPTEPPDLPLLMGVRPLSIGRRLLAFCVDLIPGIALVLILGIEAPRTDVLPIWNVEFALSVPGLVVIVSTLLHSCLSELWFGRSLGKRLFGGCVLASDGSAPRPSALLLRTFFKGVVLFAPILAVFCLLSPARQGIPESVSRTVVADTRLTRKMPDSE